jgi:palmitoyl transferase
MKKMFIGLWVLYSLNAYSDSSDLSCKSWSYPFKLFGRHVHQTWTQGTTDLYLSGYAWHNRYTYSPEQLRLSKYNELAWGGGIGKGFFDEHGNWHGLYALMFLESHRKIEPAIGYAYLKVAHLSPYLKAGLGISVLITARPDIMYNVPFPGAVPWAGLFYKQISLKAAYIPGSPTNGNVLYLVGSFSFDK